MPVTLTKREEPMYLGETDGPEMIARSVELYPQKNEREETHYATKWIESIRYLRRRRKWILDGR